MNLAKPFSDRALKSLLTGFTGRDSFVFLESTRITPENHHSYLFQEPVERLVCTAGEDPALFLDKAQAYLEQGFYLAGYLGYEFGYMLEPILKNSFKPRETSAVSGIPVPFADLGVFRKPLVYDHLQAAFVGDSPDLEDGEPASEHSFLIDNLRLNQEEDEYLKAVSRIKSYIEAGDTYQVNYTLKLLFGFSGSVTDFYCSLRRNQSVSYGALIRNDDLTVLSFSPELFFRKNGNTIDVRPMKGTMHRGRTYGEDREFMDFLHRDIKNRSENVMIVDLLRNDLGRLSRMGGVSVRSLFDIETYETLHQMTSSIRGELDHEVSLEEMFRALFPCGSVTGAPKIRTMEIIRELEADDRGVYTGAIGYISPEGEAVFNVPIRTVVLQDGRGEMGIGSGIVWDSDPAGEWEECSLKGRFLTTPAPEFELIETMLWHPESGYWLLDLHLDRLAKSADYFFYPLDIDGLKAALQQLAESFDSVPQRVRLTLSKQGEFNFTCTELPGFSVPETDPEKVMEQADTRELPGVNFSEETVNSRSVYLYHKTTLRDLYDKERLRASARGFYEVLFVNENGEVTEGSYTNIFLQKDSRLLTPPVSCGLLPGVFRNYLLKQYPDTVREKILTREDIAEADALFVGNSVRGLVRVIPA